MQNRIVLRTLAVQAMLGLTAFVGWQCFEVPEAPVAPSSDIKLSIPMADVKATIGEALPEDTSVVKRNASTGTFYYTEDQSSPPVGVGAIAVQPEKSGSEVAVGEVKVDGIPTASQTVTVGQLGIPTVNYPGANPPFIPPFPASNVSAPPISLPDQSAQFEYIRINTGTITLAVTNNLPLTMRFTAPIVLKNDKRTVPVDTSVIASFVFDSLLAGQSKNIMVNLAGKLMRGTLGTDSIKFRTDSRSDAFSITSANGISFGFGTTALIADSARAVIPEQTVSAINDSVITIDTVIVLERASFRTGSFTLRVNNNLGINVGVRLKFDNFISTRTDSSFYVDDVMSGRQVKDITVAFDTVVIRNQAPDNKGTKMKFSVGIRTINSGGLKSTITSKDFVRADFLPTQSFSVRSIVGRAPLQNIPIYSSFKGPELGDITGDFFKADSLLLNGAKIDIDMGLTGGYPVQYYLTLLAKNKAGVFTDSIVLPAPASQTSRIFLPTDLAGQFKTTTLNLNNQVGLSRFINSMLAKNSNIDSFIVKGNVVVRLDTTLPSYKPTLYDTTKFYNAIHVFFPVDFGIQNGVIKSTLAMAKGAIPKDFTKAIKSGKINMELENGIPLQLVFRGELWGMHPKTNTFRRLLKLPTGLVDSLLIQPAPVSSSTGFTTGALKSGFSFQLSDWGKRVDTTLTLNDAELFNIADSLYLTFKLITTPTSRSTVNLRQTDFIRTRMSGSLIYTINKP